MQCLTLVRKTKAYIESESLQFAPVADGVTQTNDIRPNVLSGKAAKVPILAGYNREEVQMFLAVLGAGSAPALLQTIFGILGLNSSAQQDAVLSKYPKTLVDDVYSLVIRQATDVAYGCSDAVLGSFLTRHGYDVYRYRYDAGFSDTSLFSGALAYHTIEIPEVWGTFPLRNQLGQATEQQRQLSAYMQGVWSNFAKNPAKGTGWPTVGALRDLAVIGNSGSTGQTTVSSAAAEPACLVINPILGILGIPFGGGIPAIGQIAF